MWVEFNTRVNYPVKSILMDMVDSGVINMDDLMHKFCVSWFSIYVVNVGITHLIKAWNNRRTITQFQVSNNNFFHWA